MFTGCPRQRSSPSSLRTKAPSCRNCACNTDDPVVAARPVMRVGQLIQFLDWCRRLWCRATAAAAKQLVLLMKLPRLKIQRHIPTVARVPYRVAASVHDRLRAARASSSRTTCGTMPKSLWRRRPSARQSLSVTTPSLRSRWAMYGATSCAMRGAALGRAARGACAENPHAPRSGQPERGGPPRTGRLGQDPGEFSRGGVAP